jgi:hypothetical protein
MATKRKPSGYRLDPKLPYAIYWGSDTLYGKVYLILGRGLKETVGIQQTHFLLEGNVYTQREADFSHEWPIKVSFYSRLLEFKTKECLETFLSNPRTAFSPVGSDSAQLTASEA